MIKLFCKPARLHELLLQLAELLIQQVIRLVNEANDCIGGGFRRVFEIGPSSLSPGSFRSEMVVDYAVKLQSSVATNCLSAPDCGDDKYQGVDQENPSQSERSR
jgi:hypothetical protein